MRALSLLLVLASCSAMGQARERFPGSGVGGTSTAGGSAQSVFAASFAWYGDSLTQGACNSTAPPTKLAQQLPGYVGVNRGVSGESMAQIVTRYLAGMATDCNGEMCGTYIITGGTNNCGNGECDVDAVLATHLTAVDDCLTKGRRCVSLPIPPFRCAEEIEGCTGGTYAGTLKSLEYLTKWQAACASSSRPNRSNLKCVDTFTPMEEPWLASINRGYLLDAYACSATDRVHTSQAGSDKLAELVLSVMQ